jgi:hypothetical protein
MALYHVHADVIAKGKNVGGATGFARYMAREDSDNATQFVRYLDREGGRDDLVAKGHGGLPAWAESSRHFWQMADRYERGGPKRPGTVARTYEIALPRELSPEARLDVAADIRTTFFERYPHSWAIHNPRDWSTPTCISCCRSDAPQTGSSAVPSSISRKPQAPTRILQRMGSGKIGVGRDRPGCMRCGRVSLCSRMRPWNGRGSRRACRMRRSDPGC